MLSAYVHTLELESSKVPKWYSSSRDGIYRLEYNSPLESMRFTGPIKPLQLHSFHTSRSVSIKDHT